MSSIEQPFTYQGRLIFNGIYRTTIRDDELDLDTVVERLPAFEKGSPEHPGSGYEVSKIGEAAYEEDALPVELRGLSDDTLLIRYKYEEYETQEALVEGELRNVSTRSINEVDLYWVFPDYLFLRGSKTDTDHAKEDIGRAIGGGVRINQIEFDFRFLLWMFYKHYRQEDIDPDLTINRLSDAETRNKSGAPAEIQRFTESRDVTVSESVLRDLMKILRGKTLTMIGGDFRLGDYQYAANISTSGRIQIKSQFDIADAKDLIRVLLSIYFVHKVSELYSEWETRPTEEKYPPEDFFKEVAEDLSERGVDVQFSLDETLVPYYEERSEE